MRRIDGGRKIAAALGEEGDWAPWESNGNTPIKPISARNAFRVRAMLNGSGKKTSGPAR